MVVVVEVGELLALADEESGGAVAWSLAGLGEGKGDFAHALELLGRAGKAHRLSIPVAPPPRAPPLAFVIPEGCRSG